MKVLYVEDNPNDARLAQRELVRRAPQISLLITHTLNDARAILQAGGDFDLVLSDLHLPDGNGLELLSEIREQSLPMAVVILTGQGDEEIAVAALKAGADDYLAKRAGYLERLPVVVETALARFKAEAERRAGKLRVLYAEHNAADIDLTRRHLETHAPHIRLEVVYSAREALKRLADDGSETSACDVLLIDYHLPGENAIEVLKALHDERRLDLPVVLVTGQGDEEVAAQALRLGAWDYLVKHPNYLYELPAALENAYHRARLAREQAALRESEARFRRLAENAPDIIYRYTLSPTLGFEYVSPAAAALTGYTPEEFYADPELGLELVHPEDRALLEEVTRGEQAYEKPVVMRWVHKDGSVRWMEQRNVPIYDAAGNLVALEGIARDITERKQAEEMLRLQSTAVETAANAIVITNYEGAVQWANPAFAALTGYSAAETTGQNLQSLVRSGAHSQEFYDHLWEVINAGETYHGEIINRNKNGRQQIEEITITPLLNARGQITHFISINQDITQRKQDEEEIRRRAAQQSALNSIITAASDASANLKDLLEAVLEHTLQAFEVEAGGIWTRSGGYVLRGLPPEFALEIQGMSRQLQSHLGSLLHQDDWSQVGEGGLQAALSEHMARYGIRASLSAPLWSEGASVGGISIADSRPRRWSEEDLALMEAIGRQLGIVTERARLHEEALLRAEQLAVINRIGRALSETLDLNEIFDRLSEAAHGLLPNSASLTVSMYDAEKRRFTAAYRMHDGEQVDVSGLPSTPLEPPGKGTQSQAVHARQPVIIGDLQAALGASSQMDRAGSHPVGEPEDHTAQSALIVPMVVKENVIGVMQVQSYLPDRYTPLDAELFSTLANTAAVAIQNAQLVDKIQQHLENLQALRAIDQAITSSFDLNLTLDYLLSEVLAQLRVDAADVLLLSGVTNTLDFTAGRGFRRRGMIRSSVRLGEGLVGRAALEGRMLGISNLGKESEFIRAKLLEDENFVAYYAMPLVVKGKVKGMLEVFHRSAIEPDAEWLNFLETLSGQAAIAIENAQLFDGLQKTNLELALAYDATIEGWSRAMDLRDKETEGHTLRVTQQTLELAGSFDLSVEELTHIRRGALLHDIGKMGVPDHILFKAGPLSPEEWDIMRQHPVYANEMLLPINYLRPALDIPYCHHEKWDGSGYPRGLVGEQIPLAARIFALVDVYDALTSDRPYRPAWSVEKTLEYIRAQSGAHFDPRVVEAFLRQVG